MPYGFIVNHQHLRPISASVMHRCMELTQESIAQIERIHSDWIQMEAAGENRRLRDLCADEIEFWPSDGPPTAGRKAILAQISSGSERVESIAIGDCSIRGSNDIAYLTASYKTKLFSPQNGTSREILGSHLWILKNYGGTWQIILVAGRDGSENQIAVAKNFERYGDVSTACARNEMRDIRALLDSTQNAHESLLRPSLTGEASI